jgi:hypothetical protein
MTDENQVNEVQEKLDELAGMQGRVAAEANAAQPSRRSELLPHATAVDDGGELSLDLGKKKKKKKKDVSADAGVGHALC